MWGVVDVVWNGVFSYSLLVLPVDLWVLFKVYMLLCI